MIVFDYAKPSRKLIIKCEDKDVFANLREHFSVEDKNSAFMQRKFRSRGIKLSSRKYVITPTGLCDLGLYWDVRRFLITNQITENVTITDKLKDALTIGSSNPIYNNFTLELRDYQTEVIQKAIKNGWGTCVLGTGAGKTLTTAALIENYYRNSSNKDTFKCLMVVPDLGLVQQTYDEFLNCGITFKVTRWTGNNKPDLTSNVIICNIQILQSQFEYNDWVKYVDLLIIDECHKIKPSNKISKVINTIKTGNRYGFTGTLPLDSLDKWYIIGKLGPVLYEKNSYELRLESYLTNVEVKILNLNYKNVVVPRISDSEYRDELDFIYSHEKRNQLIGRISDKLTNNTLILVNHIVHGENLLKTVRNICTNKRIFFIKGEVDIEERENIKKLMESSNDIVCIAISAIFSTGVNIKNLHNIMFVSGGKSFIRTVQSIGRGLRLHDNKDKLLIIDLCDNLHYGRQHSEKRKSIYNMEKIQYSEKDIDIS
jgi:superfamily II DNA or RNA helicase